MQFAQIESYPFCSDWGGSLYIKKWCHFFFCVHNKMILPPNCFRPIMAFWSPVRVSQYIWLGLGVNSRIPTRTRCGEGGNKSQENIYSAYIKNPLLLIDFLLANLWSQFRMIYLHSQHCSPFFSSILLPYILSLPLGKATLLNRFKRDVRAAMTSQTYQ